MTEVPPEAPSGRCLPPHVALAPKFAGMLSQVRNSMTVS